VLTANPIVCFRREKFWAINERDLILDYTFSMQQFIAHTIEINLGLTNGGTISCHPGLDPESRKTVRSL